MSRRSTDKTFPGASHIVRAYKEQSMNPRHILIAVAAAGLSGCYYVGPYSYYPGVAPGSLNREVPLDQGAATADEDDDNAPNDGAQPYSSAPANQPHAQPPAGRAITPSTGAARSYQPPPQRQLPSQSSSQQQAQPPGYDENDAYYGEDPGYGEPAYPYPPVYPAYPAYPAYPGYYPGYTIAPSISFGFGYGHRGRGRW
jgi:hypothetical protein